MRQNEMAKKVGVSKEHLNAVLCGRVRPGGKLAVRLAVETGVSLELWLMGTPEERRAAWEKFKAEACRGGSPRH